MSRRVCMTTNLVGLRRPSERERVRLGCYRLPGVNTLLSFTVFIQEMLNLFCGLNYIRKRYIMVHKID